MSDIKTTDDVLIWRGAVQTVVSHLAGEVRKWLGNDPTPTAVWVIMDGAFIFAGDFVRALAYDLSNIDFVRIDFVTDVTKPPPLDPMIRRIIVVDDLIDSGDTMRTLLMSSLSEQFVAPGVKYALVALLHKRPRSDQFVDFVKGVAGVSLFVGKAIPDAFWVYGYGMDHPDGGGRCRSAVYFTRGTYPRTRDVK